MTDFPRPLSMPDASPWSAPAMISFVLLAIWAYTITWIFALIMRGKEVASVMIGILGGIVSAETAALAAVTGFWLANSLNANRANANKDAVIAQQAGSGPPPPEPAQPVSTETAQ